MDSILKGIAQNFAQHLDAALYQETDYTRAVEDVLQKLDEIDSLHLTKEQNEAVDELLTVCNAENALSCQICYIQGLRDGVALLREIGLLEAGTEDR